MGLLKSPWERRYKVVWKQEQAFLRKHEEAALPGAGLSDKIPESVRNTLSAAFEKAFVWIFRHGSSQRKPSAKQQQTFQLNRCALEIAENRAHLTAFRRASARIGRNAVLASGVSGAGMGFLGIVLPDIPLFTVLLLNAVYDTAACFGVSCASPEEQQYALRVIQAALSDGEVLRRESRLLDVYAQTGTWPEPVSQKAQISAAAQQLSRAILAGKLIQNLPVVGTAGGVLDAALLHRVQRYAAIKYEKRFLICLRNPDSDRSRDKLEG